MLQSDTRVLLLAGLFAICLMLSALGMGLAAFWSFLPAAVLVEVLSRITPKKFRAGA